MNIEEKLNFIKYKSILEKAIRRNNGIFAIDETMSVIVLNLYSLTKLNVKSQGEIMTSENMRLFISKQIKGLTESGLDKVKLKDLFSNVGKIQLKESEGIPIKVKDENELLTYSECVELLKMHYGWNIKESTFKHNYIYGKDKEIPSIRGRGSRRVRRTDLVEWMDKRTKLLTT